MQIYLPIAEMSVDIFLLFGLGGGVGFLSGMFGVGGGFLLTPLLILIGVPPAVAVATQANQVVASSVSGVLGHWRRDNVDFKMGFVLLVGGFLGSTLGVLLFGLLKRIGQIDLVIGLSYVLLLGFIGALMLVESGRTILRRRAAVVVPRKLHQHIWLHGLPFKVRFRKSRLYISAILPIGVGFLVGIMSAIMGVGGAFILVPAMIYILGMPTVVVVGTSLFQIIFVAANVTLLQSVQNQTVDIVLAVVLTVGGVIGAQIGSRVVAKLPAEQIRVLLAALVLVVGAVLAWELVAPPKNIYSITVLGAP
ncbi:MAG: sulfite exporter TauE/SafE family protein [Pseudomonadota bacterium]